MINVFFQSRTPTPAALETPERPSSGIENFSEIIELVLPTVAKEQVKCKHLFGQSYRCNWWVYEQSAGVPAARITRSKFIRVAKTDRGLMIDDSSPDNAS